MAEWNLVLWVLALQGALGAFDVLYNHEHLEHLPHRREAAFEEFLHGLREVHYPIVFAGLAWFEWHGAYAAALALVLLVELLITSWDSVEEDRIRRVAASERVAHITLSILAGVFYTLLAPHLYAWWARPTALVYVDHGVVSWILTALAFASLAWAIRDFRSARRLRRTAAHRA
jgi:uncharacterized protein